MHGVIIVDDEKWIVEGLKAGVDWGKFSFEVIGDAENGLAALRLIEEKRPTVVFTDIRMPGLNGLELIKKAKEKFPSTIFVVLSGYAEFAYAQKALNYGAFGYCLKPFEIEEIEGLLGKIVKAIDLLATSLQTEETSNLSDAIFSGDHQRVAEILYTKDICFDGNSPIVPIVINGEDIIKLPETIKKIHFKISFNCYCYLIYEQNLHTFEKLYEDLYKDKFQSIGVGPAITKLSLLDESIEAASVAAYGAFLTGTPDIYKSIQTPIALENKLFCEISDALKRKDNLSFIQSLENIRNTFHTGQLNIKSAYALFNLVTYSDPSMSCKRSFDGYRQLNKHFSSIDILIDFLKESTLTHFEENSTINSPVVEHVTIKEIVKYINENLSTDFSIQALSKKFYLNPNYMCQLFKKEVGENFIEYISRRRIEYACKLLLETDFSVNLISEKCGFNDYFYFSKIFKKLVNMTPTQYRISTLKK